MTQMLKLLGCKTTLSTQLRLDSVYIVALQAGMLFEDLGLISPAYTSLPLWYLNVL
jgi:hypothetical protein